MKQKVYRHKELITEKKLGDLGNQRNDFHSWSVRSPRKNDAKGAGKIGKLQAMWSLARQVKIFEL